MTKRWVVSSQKNKKHTLDDLAFGFIDLQRHLLRRLNFCLQALDELWLEK